ncbi:hypothetical protein [Nocardioides pacificus]
MSTPTTVTSYCRICSGLCGIRVTVVDGRVTRVQGDRDNALSSGFTCPKGRHSGELHHAPDRFLTSQRRKPDGELEPRELGLVVEEVAERLRAIVDDHGPDAVAFFVGTQSYTSTLTFPFATA